MSQIIKFKRGLKAKLPTLNVGEPALTTDTKQIFIGGGTTNIEIAKKSDIPTTLPANGGNADVLDGIDSSGFGRAFSSSYSFGGSGTAITTPSFITMLNNLGAFNQPYWVARGSWSYAGNNYISDTGVGNIHLAGCTVEVIGNASNYTIRIHTPTTSTAGVTNTEFIYVNNGDGYSPSWRKIWNSSNDGAGSGLDADLLDGMQPSISSTANTIVQRDANANIFCNSLYGAYGTMLKSIDEWLRINDDGSHSNGIYCGSGILRTDGNFQVGANGAYFNVMANGNVSIAGNLIVNGATTSKVGCIGIGHSNEIWSLGIDKQLWINYRGYDETTNNFIDTHIGNGKGKAIFTTTGETGAISTVNNVLDDGTGNMSVKGSVKIASKFTMQYNPTEDSLDFIYG